MRAKTLLAALAIWLMVTLFFTAAVMARYIGTDKSFKYVLYANALHYGLWTLLSPLLAQFCARWPIFEGGRPQDPASKGRSRSLRIAAFVLLALLLAPLVSLANLAIIFWTYFPYRHAVPTLSALLQSDLWNAFHDDFMTCVVLLVAFQGWGVWRDLQSEQRRAAELERELAVSRLDALRMQLHPHFLFNTLHTITGLIGEDPSIARRMVVALGDLLRRTLEEPSAPVQSLARELELIDLYMGIQRLRLGDRVSLDYDIDPAATTAEVPHLLLQPLFENAVRHGASRMAGRCAIVFRAARDRDDNGGRERVRLSLENDAPSKGTAAADGAGTALSPARHGVGLTNTLSRLKLHYGDSFTFHYIERPQGGVRIELSLPYSQTGQEARDVHAPAAAGVAD